MSGTSTPRAPRSRSRRCEASRSTVEPGEVLGDRRRHGLGQEHARAAHESAPRPDERRGARRRRGRDDARRRASCGAGSGWSSSSPNRRSSPRPSRRTWPSPRAGSGWTKKRSGSACWSRCGRSGRGNLRGVRRSRSRAARSGGSPSPGCSRWGRRCSFSTSRRPASTRPPGRSLLALILGLRDAGVSVVLVSHDLDEVAEVADRVCVLREGRVRAVGTPAEVFYGDPALAPATVRWLRLLRGSRPGMGDPVRFEETLAALRALQGA